MDNQQPINKSPNILLWIIWFALLTAILTYLAVLKISFQPEEGTTLENDMLVKILGGVGLCGIAAAFFIRNVITLPMAKKLTPETMMNVLPSCIISWALAESVAIYGLVLGFQGAPFSISSAFFLVSFAAMIFLSPNFASLKGLVRVLPDE